MQHVPGPAEGISAPEQLEAYPSDMTAYKYSALRLRPLSPSELCDLVFGDGHRF